MVTILHIYVMAHVKKIEMSLQRPLLAGDSVSLKEILARKRSRWNCHRRFGFSNYRRVSNAFIGAEVGSNNTAELSAVAAALSWLLKQGGGSSVVIRADSQYALNIANGQWRARKIVIWPHVRTLWDEVSSLRELSKNMFEHIVDIVGMSVLTI